MRLLESSEKAEKSIQAVRVEKSEDDPDTFAEAISQAATSIRQGKINREIVELML